MRCAIKSSLSLIMSTSLRLRRRRSSFFRASINSKSDTKSFLCWSWSESLSLCLSSFLLLFLSTLLPRLPLSPPSSPEPPNTSSRTFLSLSSLSLLESDVGRVMRDFFFPLERRLPELESESLPLPLALRFRECTLEEDDAFEWAEPDLEPDKRF